MRQGGRQLKNIQAFFKKEGSELINIYIQSSFGVSCSTVRAGNTIQITFESVKSALNTYEYLSRYFDFIALEKVLGKEEQQTTWRYKDFYRITLINK